VQVVQQSGVRRHHAAPEVDGLGPGGVAAEEGEHGADGIVVGCPEVVDLQDGAGPLCPPQPASRELPAPQTASTDDVPSFALPFAIVRA
jgi:hypothetical protein